jgi:hypothetical protein
MTEQTLTAEAASDATSEQSGLVAALAEISDDGGPRTDGDFSALAGLIIDGTLAGDEDGLRHLQRWLRHELAQFSRDEGDDAEMRGRLRGLLDVSHWAIARVLPLSDIQAVGRGTHREHILKALAADPGMSNRELVESLGIDDESQVSRLGAELRELGLVVSQRIGRRNRWELSPKGIRTLDAMCGVSTVENLANGVATDEGSHVESCEEREPSYAFMTSLIDLMSRESGAFRWRWGVPRVDTGWRLLATVRDSGAQLLKADLSAEGKKNLAAVADELRRKEPAARSTS